MSTVPEYHFVWCDEPHFSDQGLSGEDVLSETHLHALKAGGVVIAVVLQDSPRGITERAKSMQDRSLHASDSGHRRIGMQRIHVSRGKAIQQRFIAGCGLLVYGIGGSIWWDIGLSWKVVLLLNK